jgi:membrane-bound lytic murein transglycosylase D
MKSRHNWIIGCVLILFFLSWACSSSRTPKRVTTESPPQPAQENQPAAPQEYPPLQEEPSPVPPQEKEIKEEIAEESPDQEKELFTDKEEPGALLEEALNAYQDALGAWENGDSDLSLQNLDEAYNLILKAQLPQDSALAQEKNDLRLLIAQRIQQIYASRPVTVGDNHKTIPLEENKDVNDEIVSFQTVERKLFQEAYQRSGFYRDMILEELRKEGLPEELSWLPMIESWFKIKALSKARALGLWQFISSTGYRFGLKRDRWVDERMDPVKSSRAAVKYLAQLHAFFGDWTTALAAYNCGEIRVQNCIRTQRVDYMDNFWDLYRQLPRETARFVPRFIAAVLIVNNPEKYGFSLPGPFAPLEFETIAVSHPFKLSVLATSLGIDSSELAFLNPELRFESTPNYEYQLRVPADQAEKASLALDNIPRWIPPEAAYTWHYVRRGETLSTIAARYRTSVSAIVRLNGLRRRNFIRQGQRLKIPGRGVPASASPRQPAPRLRQPEDITGEKTTYTIREGDTPYSIAKKFGMNLDDFLVLNGLNSNTKIYPGQEVLVVTKNQPRQQPPGQN